MEKDTINQYNMNTKEVSTNINTYSIKLLIILTSNRVEAWIFFWTWKE